MNSFNGVNNRYYFINQDLSNLEKFEERSWEGITNDRKKIYILKECFDSLPDEIKNAFKNLKYLDLCDFHYLTLLKSERRDHSIVNKAKLDERISKFRRKENLVQLQTRGLNPDILEILVSHLSLNTKEVFTLTSQHLKEAVNKKKNEAVDKIDLKKICEHAAKEGNLKVLKWARKNGALWDEGVCSKAARRGHLEVLKWARKKGAPWDVWVCSRAARGGHLKVLKWALSNGAHLGKSVCSRAARRGHLEVLKWARANGAPWDESVCSRAARGGHLDILQWARANGAPWNGSVCSNAALAGNLEMLKWARENGAPWYGSVICLFAVATGHLEMLKWVRANGAPWNINSIRTIAIGKLKILEYLDANP